MSPHGNRQRRDQDANNRIVEFAAGLLRDRRGTVDVLFTLDALGRQFECPGEEQRKRQADRQQEEQGFHHPVRCSEAVEREFGYLGDEPGGHQVCNGNTNDVAAFQFDEYRHSLVTNSVARVTGKFLFTGLLLSQ